MDRTTSYLPPPDERLNEHPYHPFHFLQSFFGDHPFFPSHTSLTGNQAASQSALVHHRRRSRMISLLSVKSGAPEKLSLESPKAQATMATLDIFENHLARGSFALNAPATTVLRTFLPTMHPRTYQRSYSTSLEKEEEVQPSPSSSSTPLITRTLSLSSDSRSTSPERGQTLPRTRTRSRSRSRTCPRTQAYSDMHSPDLHPVLADLEQRSKFCEKKSVCSTCNREGTAFPQCGKCGDSWCCRECRLKGRTKHSCRVKSA